MLNKAVLSFIEKVNSDAELHGKVAGEPRLDVMVKVAADNGFMFTGEEWINTVKALYAGELSDDALGKVAGGVHDISQPLNPLGLQGGQAANLLIGQNASGVPPFNGKFK